MIQNHKERIDWIDIFKYICIMFVMLCHLESNTHILDLFLSPFVVNGFFFASGYVYNHKDKFKVFLSKKVKGLLIPWLIFSVLNIALSQILSFNEHASLWEELKNNFLQIRRQGDGIWFVAALFVTYIPFYFLINLYEKKKSSVKYHKFFLVMVVFTLSIVRSIYLSYMNPSSLPWNSTALPWHLEDIFLGMFWMTLGYVFRGSIEEWIEKRITNVQKVLLFLFYVTIIYLPDIVGLAINNKMLYDLYSYLPALTGILLIMFVSKRIMPNWYILYIGQNTIICFALNGKAYSIIQSCLHKVKIYSSILENVVYSTAFAIAFAIVISVIMIVPIYIINRWFPFLVGRKFVKHKCNARK